MKSFFFLLPILLFLSCKNDKQAPQQKESPTPELTEFNQFYQRFHQDSLFQMNHTVFPLKGLPSDADSLTLARDDFFWQRKDWVLHKSFDFGMSDFKRKIIPIGDTVVVERIVHKTGAYGMVRRFAKVGGEWQLIYYAGLNWLVK